MRFIIGCKPGEHSEKDKSVGIIGAGPAGLYAAGYLKCKGYKVTIYDQMPEPGGFMIFGVLEIHIDKEKVKNGIKELKELGVVFKQNTRVGRDILLGDIIKAHDAVLIATGTWKSKRLSIPGSDLPEVLPATEWIVDYHLWKYGYSSEKPMIKPRVLVVGGGLTAVDAVYVSKWLGAEEIYVSYRRTREYAPAGTRGFKEMEEQGATVYELTVPVEYIEENGHLTGVKLEKLKLVQEPGKRPKPVGTGEYFTLKVDMVLEAIGLIPTPPFNGGDYGIKLRDDGTIDVDEYKRTTREPVFAAGDVSHGASLIGPAAKSGLDAAKAIEAYLEGRLGWRTS